MKRIVFVVLIIILFIGVRYSTIFDSEKQFVSKPNVVFISVDELGFGDLKCYGGTEVTTPNIDKLAGKGTRYTQFYVTSDECSLSRSTLLTGHFPARYKNNELFIENETDVSSNAFDSLNVFLPKLMQKGGYNTAHFGKWNLGSEKNIFLNPKTSKPREIRYDANFSSKKQMKKDTNNGLIKVKSFNRFAVDEVIGFIKKNKQKGPFFVNLRLNNQHSDIMIPLKKDRKNYKTSISYKKKYYSAIKDMDFHIGRLMEGISKMGLDENTLIVFASNNGSSDVSPELNQKELNLLRIKKRETFQQDINVPFILKWKNHIKEGRIDNQSVLSLVDMLPTLQELCQLELPKLYKSDGENFGSIFQNIPFKRTKPLYWEFCLSKLIGNSKKESKWPTNIIRKGKWKLLYNDEIQRVELYDIVDDPYEKEDLAFYNNEKIIEMKKLQKDWKQTLSK